MEVKLEPIEIERLSEKFIRIKWLDGFDSTISLENLRNNCPCAECQGEEIGGTRIRLPVLNVQSKQRKYEIVSIEPIGNYALQIHWGDGHNTGIYSYEYLRNLMERFRENTEQ